MKGVAVVNVELAGQYLLVPFIVVEAVYEVLLEMDFLRLDGVERKVAKGELHLGEGGIVYTHNAGPTVPSSKAQLVGQTVILASSVARFRVKCKFWGL